MQCLYFQKSTRGNLIRENRKKSCSERSGGKEKWMLQQKPAGTFVPYALLWVHSECKHFNSAPNICAEKS